MGSNKPRGLQAARKLRTTRRENRWVRHYRRCLDRAAKR
jgi:small subunit ribosomal protein S23e